MRAVTARARAAAAGPAVTAVAAVAVDRADTPRTTTHAHLKAGEDRALETPEAARAEPSRSEARILGVLRRAIDKS